MKFAARFARFLLLATVALYAAALQAQGWQPAQAQAAKAQETYARFVAATDEGRYKDAYAMLGAPMKAMTGYDQYVAYHEEFRNISGGSPRREPPRVDWYKDPPGAPAPGIYAIFKSKCAFRDLGACEETVVLHEQAGAFLVMRAERSYVKR